MAVRAENPNWGIILAGGSGTRLSGFTTDGNGDHVPKQYCSLDGGPTLLEFALERARSVVPPQQIVIVVAEDHERHWAPLLRSWPVENLLVQPQNRGTAPGILLPLLSIMERDPAARIALFPSDHFVEQELVLARCLRSSLWAIDEFDRHVILLGITPDCIESNYGWILPGVRFGRARSVRAFVEKPDLGRALELQRLGAVWNSFLLVASGQALIDLFKARAPTLFQTFRDAWPPANLEARHRLYDHIESADFSREILEGAERRLRLRIVPSCGWTDLGTPERVARCLAARDRAAATASGRGPSLALALNRS